MIIPVNKFVVARVENGSLSHSLCDILLGFVAPVMFGNISDTHTYAVPPFRIAISK
jgi:hypothetical protein